MDKSEYNIKCKCNICGKIKNCKEVETLDAKPPFQKKYIEFWCEDCENDLMEEYYRQQEEDMQELYEYISGLGCRYYS